MLEGFWCLYLFIKGRCCCEKSICTTDLKRLVELSEGLITLAMVLLKGLSSCLQQCFMRLSGCSGLGVPSLYDLCDTPYTEILPK